MNERIELLGDFYKRVFVVCGRGQFRGFIQDAKLRRNPRISILDDPYRLRGATAEDTAVVFYGTYAENKLMRDPEFMDILRIRQIEPIYWEDPFRP